MNRWIVPALAGLVLLVGTTLASAQTTTTTTPSTGTFSKLSTGNQKIVTALYEAQTGPTKASLDDIAAMKKTGKGWGEVFKEMKSQGLVTQKNLGEVVSSYERQHHEAERAAKASRPDDRESGMAGARGSFGGATHAGGRGK